jgi:hypothetical protein
LPLTLMEFSITEWPWLWQSLSGSRK